MLLFVFCFWQSEHFDGLVQDRRNFIANALELPLSCTYLSICSWGIGNQLVHLENRRSMSKCFSFCANWTIFLQIYSKLNIWSWKFNIQVKFYGHIWGVAFYQYFRIQFHGNLIFFSRDSKFRYLTMKIQGRGHGQGHTLGPHLRPSILLMCFFFIWWQSHHSFRWYSKSNIWPVKLKRSRSWLKIDQKYQVIYSSGSSNLPKMMRKVVQKLSHE